MRIIFSAMLAFSLLACSGCVALNLPSDRFDDPADDGGLFGDWRSKSVDPIGNLGQNPVGHGNSAGHGSHCQANSYPLSPGGCLMGDELGGDPFDTTQGEYAKPEDPEVPWPRYHPVPTRPVFGGF